MRHTATGGYTDKLPGVYPGVLDVYPYNHPPDSGTVAVTWNLPLLDPSSTPYRSYLASCKLLCDLTGDACSAAVFNETSGNLGCTLVYKQYESRPWTGMKYAPSTTVVSTLIKWFPGEQTDGAAQDRVAATQCAPQKRESSAAHVRTYLFKIWLVVWHTLPRMRAAVRADHLSAHTVSY